MHAPNAQATARMMIAAHGMQAQAIAQSHIDEKRQQHDTAGLEHWTQVHAAVCELRRTGAKAAAD